MPESLMDINAGVDLPAYVAADAPPAYNPNISDFASYVNIPGMQVNPRGDGAMYIGKGNIVDRAFSTTSRAFACSSGTYNSLSYMLSFIAMWSMYGILGYTTGLVVKEQNYLEKSGQEPIKGLPGKLTVYIAAGIFSVCKLLQGLMSFFASKQEHQLREDLIIMYAEVRSKAEDKVGVRLPKAYLSSFDTPRTLQGIIGIFAIGVGNWLISKDHVSYGLLACIAGAAVGSDAIQGFVATERAVIQGMIGILNGILSGMVGNPVLTSDFQTRLARLNDLRKKTEYWGIH